MKVKIVYPPAVGKINGNLVTANRCADLFRELGHEVCMETDFTTEEVDMVLALHAFKSYPIARRFKQTYPDKKLVMMLTGTDIYSEYLGTFETQESLELADKIVVLQKEALSLLPAKYAEKAMVIHQSVKPLIESKNLSQEFFDICLIGNLRRIKDPFILVNALAGLPEESKIRVHHIGGAIEEEMANRARDYMKETDRYIWHGELDYHECQKTLNNSHLMVLSSIAEGGANVISEALVYHVPVICTEISCHIGLLGADHPGFFEVGNTNELRSHIQRAETDENFLKSLLRSGQNVAQNFEVETELAAWQELLKFS